MAGIYFKEGIYLLIEIDVDNSECIFHPKLKSTAKLFGGRVQITTSSWGTSYSYYLSVDGFKILECISTQYQDGTYSQKLESTLPLPKITSYLNSIETNGLDAFINNYKQSVTFLYNEFKELTQKTESQFSLEVGDTKKDKLLDQLEVLRKMLFIILGLLFNLSTYMSTGIENEKIKIIHQAILDSIS